jgi:predicted nucleic acid-binding protein
VTAANDAEARERFEAFLERHGPLVVSAVVVAEVLIGVADIARHGAVARALCAGTVVAAPAVDDWARAVWAVAKLGGRAVTRNRSFWNNALLAAQCARLGVTLVTHNGAGFRRLARHIGVRAVAPFP